MPSSHAVVVAGGQALVRAARRSVLARAGLDVVADVDDASRAAKAAELYGAGLVLVDSEISGGCRRRRPPHHRAAAGNGGASSSRPSSTRRRCSRWSAPAPTASCSETLGASGLVRAVEVALHGDSVIPRAGVGTLIEQLRGGGAGADAPSTDNR